MSKNCKTASSSSLGQRVACNADLFEDSLWVNSEAETIERHMPVPPSLRVLYPADLSEVVSAVEDLWLRIRRQPGVRIHVVLDKATDMNLLLLRADRANLGKEGQDLLEAAEDLDRYRWLQSPDGLEQKTRQDPDRPGYFPSSMAFNLLLRCISLTARWPSGMGM